MRMSESGQGKRSGQSKRRKIYHSLGSHAYSSCPIITLSQPHLNTLLLQAPERLLDLLIQLLKLARNILLALRVGRLELHLRQLERAVACCVTDLLRQLLPILDCVLDSSPWQMSYRSTRQRAASSHSTPQSS